MNRLVGDLLDLSRIEAGQPLSIEPSVHDGKKLIQEAVELLAPLASARQLQLVADAPDALCQLLCDGDRIQEIFSNLIGNAIKFSREGGTITVRVRSVSHEVVFSVADEGIGIAPAQIPHVFDPYWQVKATRQSGIGLGLSVVQGLVRAHHGHIWVESTVGQGSTFYFALPVGCHG